MKLTKSTFFLGCLVGGMGAALLPLLINPSKAETKLLPFQGRLTDAGGNAIADGAKVVEFKMYDAPTGGNVKWAGEVHKLSVNGGLVNTMLGSKAGLGSVDFSSPSFLQITVDANGDGQITAADPPLLPRQTVMPAVYAVEAGNARKLNGADWSAVMVDSLGAPTTNANDGFLSGAKLKNDSVDGSKVVSNSITSSQIGNSAVTSEKIFDGTITGRDVANGAIPLHQKVGVEYAFFWDQKEPGENGGAATGNAWNFRALNHGQDSPNGDIMLSNDTIQLKPGVYHIRGSCPAYFCLTHQAVLRDVTPGANNIIVIQGTSEFSFARDEYASVTRSLVEGYLTVSGPNNRSYRVSHYIGAASYAPAYVLGVNNQSGVAPPGNNEPTVYSQIHILRVR